MSFLAWIVLGPVAGYIGSKLVNRTGEGMCATFCWEWSAPGGPPHILCRCLVMRKLSDIGHECLRRVATAGN